MQHYAAIANVTHEPELRYTANQNPVLDLNCVVNERAKKGDEWVDAPVYYQVTFWGKAAEYLADQAEPGDSIPIGGKLKLEQWETEDGKRSKLKVTQDPSVWPTLYRRKPRKDEG